MLNYFMGVAVIFGTLVGALGDLGIMVIGTIQSITDYTYAIFNFLLILWLRQNKNYFHSVAWCQVVSSFITFFVALLVVDNDEFRIVWFYVAVYIAYILLGVRAGIGITLATFIVIVTSHIYTDLHLSDTAIYTAILGLLVASLLTRAYSTQILVYESQLRKKNQQLENKVGELDVALEKAKVASKTKSMFLANMSHEIRTPMNGVLSMVQVLKTTELDELQTSYLKSIERSGENLLALIDDLLDLSKIESGRIEIKHNRFNTWELVEDILVQVEPLFDDTNVNFNVDISNDMPPILVGDEMRLKQVVANLVNNAAKFTRQGQVKLIIYGELTTAEIYRLSIVVEDTGIGIPDEALKTIFKPFQQLSPERIINRGVGLGLPICKSLVEAMNGTLQVSSMLGQGSRFIVELMLPVAERQQALQEHTAKHAELQQLKILLVDDDQVSRFAIQTLLNKKGHQVLVVTNGAEAINKLAEESVDIILMDVHMPVMDGIQATRRIKTEGLSKAPVIGMTASVMNDERASYLEQGMDALVEKPVDFEHLVQIIKTRLPD